MGACLTHRNDLSEETHVLTVQETLECQGGEPESKGTQEDCSVMWFAVAVFMVIRLVSLLSLADCFDPGSFLVVHTKIHDSEKDSARRW